MFTDGKITEETLEALKLDERKGVQTLLARHEKAKLKQQKLIENYAEMMQFENEAKARGYEFIAGIDEAGRGPLAGPVVSAAVILPPDFTLIGLNDSKQLSEEQRNNFFDIIKENAISFSISMVSNEAIDKMNILEATKLSMRQAIDDLKQQPDHVLIDAVALSNLPCTSQAIIKGDARSVSIAAASILAKVARDRFMKEIHNKYPMYDFDSNMGYGTKKHMDSLLKYGATPYHRKSFAPVRNVIGQ